MIFLFLGVIYGMKLMGRNESPSNPKGPLQYSLPLQPHQHSPLREGGFCFGFFLGGGSCFVLFISVIQPTE